MHGKKMVSMFIDKMVSKIHQGGNNKHQVLKDLRSHLERISDNMYGMMMKVQSMRESHGSMSFSAVSSGLDSKPFVLELSPDEMEDTFRFVDSLNKEVEDSYSGGDSMYGDDMGRKIMSGQKMMG